MSGLRIGLGCMRLSTDGDRDEERASATIAAAADAGVTIFDTAHAYARDETELGHNERLLARALRGSAAARIVTKGGMARTDGRWIPDGRAKTIRTDCEASLAALDGIPIDLYLIHAPDPKTPWRTTVRALARLADDGLVKRIGVSNVNRAQLEEALDLAPIAAVQIALSPFDNRAVRGGVLEFCEEESVDVMAHSPLGGPRRAAALTQQEVLARIASARDATPAEVALAWLLALSPVVVAIPGARRPETARSAANATKLELSADERAALDRAFGTSRAAPARRARRDGDVVVVMGIPGAGKTRATQEYVARGYVRLNRDERGGSLRELADALDEALAADVNQVVLDNTYLTRAARSYVIDVAHRHGFRARCVWIDVPLAQAQVNLVERLLDRFGTLPPPEQLRKLARSEPGVHTPTTQMRSLRELEPPAPEEGFAAIEHVMFARAPANGRSGVFVAAAALQAPASPDVLADNDAAAPHLLFDWRPDACTDALAADAARLSAAVPGPVESALCTHGGGAPTCWCRPPLPGLALAFARKHGVDPAQSILIGTSSAHRTLAAALGAEFIAP